MAAAAAAAVAAPEVPAARRGHAMCAAGSPGRK
eukprot:CAMPEP_0202361882 /NCGR_PEP_ID=MMETSP1126-20121109/14269_1 /ASSEMBLY_ACC=CAM_ASM_000457 /TAXON_ID=3047 /ORGANISM="Dunaliella tertiolecta, Strain CCMP1320" /LENGTH=32 /DNA_ID= /DNA_START= /DNA_END= /DNA_ORIENTATION=